MTSLTLLVLLVAPTPGPDDAIARAAHEVLGPDAAIVVRRLPAPPNDAEALDLERQTEADAVAEIVWAPRSVALHVHLAHDLRWIDRELHFSRVDSATEQWRTVGFALGTMMPDPPAAEAPLPPARAADATVAPSEPEPDRVTTEPPRPRRWAFDLAVLGSGPIHSDEGGVGGTIAAHWYFADHFGVRAAAALRTSEIEQGPTEARSYFIDGALGVVWRSDARPAANTFSLAARCDLLLSEQEISRVSRIDPERTFHRLVPGADLVGQALWYFTPQTALFTGVGGQAAIRTSPVRVEGTAVATVPPLSPVFEGGLRAAF